MGIFSVGDSVSHPSTHKPTHSKKKIKIASWLAARIDVSS
jgi:hypothetical protein